MKKLSDLEKRMLNTIRINGVLSKKQLSELENISLTKIDYVLSNPWSLGIIQKVDGKSTGGRRPKLFKLKDDLFFSMGIEVGAQNTRIVIIDTNGTILANLKKIEPLTDVRKIDLPDIMEMGNELLKSISFSWNNISTIGVAIAGLIDQKNGRCLFLPNAPHWENLDIVGELKRNTGVKNIDLTDNVKSISLSESRYGKGKGLSSFLLFYIGTGIGVGIIANGKLLHGNDPEGIIGEIGHIYVGESSEMCVCGNYGCLESMASGRAMVIKAKKAITQGVFTSLNNIFLQKGSINIQDIIDATEHGDKFAVNLFGETAGYLSIGISTLVNLFNPQAIIISGGLARRAGDLLLMPLVSEIKAKTIPWLRKHINIIQSDLGEYAAARGTATLALDYFFCKIL